MKLKQQQNTRRAKVRAFTLAEVAVALAIAVLLVASISLGFVQSARQAEWSAYNLAAHSLALQGIEQARAAKWDPLAIVPVDSCTTNNFPPVTTNQLDVPMSVTNGIGVTYATNTWTITMVSTNPYPLKMIRVDTTWRFVTGRGISRLYTNTVATLRAPDQ